MTEAEILVALAKIDPRVALHKAHPAWPAFVRAMINKQYGAEPTIFAWLWFASGWDANGPPLATAEALREAGFESAFAGRTVIVVDANGDPRQVLQAWIEVLLDGGIVAKVELGELWTDLAIWIA